MKPILDAIARWVDRADASDFVGLALAAAWVCLGIAILVHGFPQ